MKYMQKQMSYDATQRFLAPRPKCITLAGIADILMVDAALEAGLFGEAPASQELRRRIGDVLVLPHAGHFVWWREAGIVENILHGHHGGLTAEELITVTGVLGG